VRHEVALEIGEPVARRRIATVPMAPPRLRIVLNRPEAAPASLCATPTNAMAEIGVMTIAWPSARVTLGQKSCGAA
jgi:hypothetical protein